MTDYTQITDFSAKDALTTGDPEKAISGADVDGELAGISTAMASKIDEPGSGALGRALGNDGTDPVWISGSFQWVETLDLTNGGANDVSYVDFTTDMADGYIYKVVFLGLSGDAGFNPEVKLYNASGSAIVSGSTAYVSSGSISDTLGPNSSQADSMPLMAYTGYTSMPAGAQLHGEFTIYNAMSTALTTVIMGRSYWSITTIGTSCEFGCRMETVQGNLNVRIGVDGAVNMDRGDAYLYRMKVV